MAEDINPIQEDRMLGMEQRLTDELKPVNLPIEIPNVVPRSSIGEPEGKLQNTQNYKDIFYNLLDQASPKTGNDFPSISGSDIDLSGRYPKFYPGRDNEEMYAQSQGGFEKAYNGITKMAGIASATFINGTVGAVYGAIKSAETGKISSFYSNDLATSLNDWTDTLENKYAHYKTEREKNGSWWEPANVFTGNFLWDGIVKNLGFSLGAAASGFAWGGALKAIGLTSKLMSGGVKLASQADDIIANAALLPATQRLSAINSELSAALGSVGKGLMKSDRAIVAAFGTIGEAGLEALSSSKAFREQMINDFVADKGYQPTEADLEEINRLSESVGNFSYFANSALLTATNYIQLPKIFSSSFKNEKNILNNIDFTEGKYVDALPTKGFGKLLYKSKNVASLFFNTSEAFEEGAQFAIQTGTQNYFKKKSKGGEETSAMDDGVLYGIREALTSDEGTLNIFTGGFSGALQSSGIVGLKNNRPAIGATGKIGERGITGYGGEEGKLRGESIVALNKSMIKDKMKDAYSNIKAAEVIQTEREEAIRRGDILESKDLEFDYAHNFITTRLKYNAKESIDFEIASLKQQAITDFLGLKQEGYAAATDTQESFLRRLDNLQAHADNTVKLYEAANLKYKGLVNKETGKPIYSEDILDKLVYAASKVADYDLRAPQLATNLLANNISVGGILEDIVLKGVPSEEATKEALSAIDALNTINSDELKTDLKDLIELSLRRKQFLDEYKQIKSTPEDFKEPEPIAPENQLAPPPLKPGEKVPTVDIKTKTGEKQIEIGTEYFLGRVVGKDKNGKDVYRLPRLTVLGENEDGTIQIKDNNGVRNISKEEFEDYKLSKVETTLKDKKAKYFLEHWNVEFEHYGRKNKDGSPAVGRLEWSDKDKILTFVYTRDGKTKSEEVTGDQFEPKKGYKHGIIKPIGKLTREQEKAQEELVEDAKTDPRVTAKRAERIRILSELFDELSVRQDKTIALIDRKQKQIAKIKEDLAKLEQEIANAEVDGRSKNSVRFKAATKKALANAISLSRTQEQLEEQVVYLENDSQELDFNLSYISDLISNVDLLPTDSKELLAELNENIFDLEVLQETTYKQIATITSLIKETEKALNSFINFISNLIEKFEAKFPNVPRIMGQDYVDFLKANPNFLKLKPYYREELSELEDLIGMVEDGDISPSQTKIDNLKEHLVIMEKDAQEFQKEIDAKTLVLKKFEQIADQYKKQKEEDDKFQKDENLIQQFMGTLGGYTQTQMKDDSYEESSKKSDEEVVGATRPVDDDKPFNIRANNFGFRFQTLPNKNKLTGTIVTSKTQDDIIPGLTQHLLVGATADERKKYKPEDTIVLVVTDEKGRPVDENGVTIPKGADLLNTAIYQVFPSSELMGMYGGKYETMFRKSTNATLAASLRRQYGEWRAVQLAKETLDKPKSLSVSFGIPQYVTYKDENGKDQPDKSVRNSVQDSGLIKVDATRDDLSETHAVVVATTNTFIKHGNTTFTTPLGGVFLKVTGGLYKLFNRKFNNKEANVIYDVILQLAKNANASEEGKVGPESTNLITWLKSVVYWGINKTQEGERKKAGYNSIWFETVKEEGKPITRLFISGKETDSTKQFEFTPLGLKERKDEIITLLSNMYSNTDAKLTGEKTYNKPYTQIVGIDKEGNLIPVTWPNYQTYLLSNKAPDVNGKLTAKRPADEIPLTTPFRVLKDSEDVNKKGFFFKLKGPSEFSFVTKTPEAEAKAEAVVEETPTATLEGKPAEAPKVVTAPEGKYKLDGEAINNIELKGNQGTINFTADINKIKYDPEKGVEGDIAYNADAVTKANIAAILRGLGKITEDTSAEEIDKMVRLQMLSKVIGEIKPQLEAAELLKLKPEIIEETPMAIPVSEEEVISQDESLNAILASVQDVEEDEDDDEVYRVELANRAEVYTPEKWEDIKVFLAKVFPNVPFYRVKNLIQATNGRQAFGMFKKGAIYVYENAEVGTTYHEVFEAVWKMFADPKEKQAIIKEFKNRKGSFVDRETGNTVKYSDANAQQAKEELAEEFRTFVLTGKTKTEKKSFIAKLFSDLVNFIKEFFTGENAIYNSQQLFEKITGGYYAQYNPYESNLSYANKGIIDIDIAEGGNEAEYRIKTIPAQQVSDIVDNMAYSTLAELSKTNESLFNTGAFENKSKLLARLKVETLLLVAKQIKLQNKNIIENKVDKAKGTRDLANMVDLYKNIESKWENLAKRYEEKLKTLSIEFDENDSLIRTDEDNTGKGDYIDARKIDNFRKSNGAIKLLFGTLAQTTIKDGKIVKLRSSIGGAKLLAADRVYIVLKNALYDSLNIDDMFIRLKEMGKVDSNYAKLYERITRNSMDEEVLDFSEIQDHDLQLMAAFWKAMKGQNADVLSVFILANNQVVIGDSNLSQASRQAKRKLSNNIIGSIKADNPYVKYDKKTTTYSTATNAAGEKIIEKYTLNPSQLQSYVSFLEKLGVSFKLSDLEDRLNDDQREAFIEAVNGIKNSLTSIKNIANLSTNSLSIDGRLLELGAVQAIIENPEFESTYFNVNGERTQTYLGTNALSNLHDVLSKLSNIKELESTEYAYLLTDAFNNTNISESKGDASVMLSTMFNVETTGNRKAYTQELMKPVYIDGTINEKKNKKKESSNLTIKERIIQELNLNLSGVFMNLVPGDAAIEWAIRMFKKESPFVTKETFDSKYYLNIFKNYFLAEVNLAKDKRKTVNKKNSAELRFFKDILGEDYTKVWNKESKKLEPEEIYKNNESVINKAVEAFIKQEALDTRDLLNKFGIAKYGEEGLMVEDLLFAEDEYISEEELTSKLNLVSVNYIIANIEMHKLLYSDPYQYKDELKRIKNFNSPRQPLLAGSGELNSAFNRVYNKSFSKTDIGYSDMTTEMFKSSVISDIFSSNELPGYEKPYEETDGGGYITPKAYRIFSIRSSNWTPANEAQYKYDIAYEKTVKGENLTEDEKAKKGLTITKEETKFNIKKIVDDKGNVRYVGKNPNVKSTYTTLKPIVSGSKADGKTFNDIVLDKFALTPLSFRVLHELNPTSNALKLYDKMQAEKVDYSVYNSGRKVGAGLATPLYNLNGSFNTSPFEEINNIPFSIMGVQAEIPSKDLAEVTQGSQITKLVKMDMMEAGMPIDFLPGKDFNKRYAQWTLLEDKESYNNGENIYKEIKNNQKLLEERIKVGYKILLKKLGIKEILTEGGEKDFEIQDADKLINTLTDEILKREVNENIIEAFEEFKKNKNTILEATPAYQQIRNILFSIADKNISSPKISGGSKVLVSSALLESVRAEGIEFKDEKGNTKIKYDSSNLRFYINKDGERVCEIMIGRWFKSDMSDKDLLKYLNTTDEGQKILKGIGFRIPTQKQNSIDVFRIKQFLPESFGDNIILPSELVRKAGSDFDIDKLYVYLKNVFQDVSGRLKIVTRKGSEEDSKKEYTNLYRDKILSKVDKIQNTEQFKNNLLNVLYKIEKVEDNEIDFANDEEEKFFNDNKEILQQIINQAADAEINPSDYIKDQLSKIEGKKEDLVSKLFNINLKEDFVDNMYKKALENEYIQSLENLVSHPLNFDNLIKPNSAQELNDLSDEIVELIGEKKIDYSNIGNMLNRKFMSQLRQDFVSGKYAIGIAATAQTNHAENQASLITIDPDKRLDDRMPEADRAWLGDGIIKLAHNVIQDKGVAKATLSMINSVKGKSISDVIGQFIDGFVDIAKGPWIMKLGATPNVVGTWLFLTKIGVPIRTTGYFMNQPIIRDYLRTIQSDGYSYLFMDKYVIDMIDIYTPQEDISVTELPSESDLRKMIGKKTRELSNTQKAQQQLILEEFLKYAKMAEHLFKVQQATKFDTASFNDPYLIFKKRIQLAQARYTIISSVDELLKNSFINSLKVTLYDVRDAFATILLSDKKGKIREVMESVLLPYVNKSDRDFIKISQRAVNALFDWAMLNNTDYIDTISATLLGDDTEKSVARQIIEFKTKMIQTNNPLKDNLILKALEMEAGKNPNKPDNLYIAGRDNKSYDQNLIIDSFRQLREALGTENKDLYGKLVRLAVLQSGLTTSPISFTSLLPYEDFNDVYNNSLSELEKIPNLGDFKDLNVFERTNWSNSDAVPFKFSTLVKNVKGGLTNINEDFVNENLKAAYKREEIPMTIAMGVQSLEGRSDIITYSWHSKVIKDPKNPDNMIPITKKLKAEARKRDDYSYVKKGLFQKVYTEDDNGNIIPLVQVSEYKGKVYKNFVYKHINAWGDSFRANESYPNNRPSRLDNGYEKAVEVSDVDITLIFNKPLRVREVREEKSIILKGGEMVSPSEISEGLLDFLGYSKTEIKEMLAKYKTPVTPSTSVKPTVKDLSRWADIKDATTPYTDKGIVVTRVGTTDNQFGNPFIGSKRRDTQGNLIESKVDNITVFNTIDEADQAYRDWLMGTKHQNIKPLRREWILKQINEGKLDGKTLLYYKPMEVTNNDGTIVRGGYHSHADTLAEIVEELRSKSTQPSNSVNAPDGLPPINRTPPQCS